jgi:selenocysteine lyase/cysteine desulfurase
LAQRGGVIAFDLKGRMPSRVARALAEGGGIGVRSGCHCAHMLIKRLAGVPPWAERVQKLIVTLFPRFELPGVVRVSLGLENTDADVERLASTLRALTSRELGARGKMPRRLESFVAERTTRVWAS